MGAASGAGAEAAGADGSPSFSGLLFGGLLGGGAEDMVWHGEGEERVVVSVRHGQRRAYITYYSAHPSKTRLDSHDRDSRLNITTIHNVGGHINTITRGEG